MVSDVVHLYLRLSPYGKKEKRDQKIMSLSEQEKLLRRQAKQFDLVVGQVFRDDGISAANDEPEHRPGFVDLCAAIEDGTCDYIAAVAGDRFARSNAVMNWLLAKCVKHGVKMLKEGSLSDPGGSPAAMAMAQIEGVMGEMESAIKSARVKRAREVSAHAGRPHGGLRPFGWNDDRLTLHPVEGPAYRELFDRVIAGEGVSRIACDWESRGIVNSKGARLDAAVVAKLVHAPRAIGKRIHHGEIVADGEWVPIVPAEVQRRAQAAMKARRPLRMVAGSRRPPRLLSSMIRCAECDEIMRAQAGKSYVCDKQYSRRCGKTFVNAPLAEDEVASQFLALLSDPRTLKKLKTLRGQRPDVAGLLGEVERLTTEINALADDLASGDVTRAEWQIIRKGYQTQLDAAQARLDDATDIPALVTIDPTTVLSGWDSADIDTQRAWLGAFLNAANVTSTGGPRGSHVWNPERIVCDWRV